MRIKVIVLAVLSFLFISTTVDWGFFGHRRINKLAAFTLPQDIFGFYKSNIAFVSDHAIDPDKRRYASKHEAVRHYIDLDIWGEHPFNNVPRGWTDMLMHYSSINSINSKGDTIQILGPENFSYDLKNPSESYTYKKVEIPYSEYKNFVRKNIVTNYYEEERDISKDSLSAFFDNYGINIKGEKFFTVDKFSEHGIVPFHLVKMQRDLTRAFENKDINRILRTSADFGHYISDAHVPLHTTENYNGQLTDQLGIHAFWESRIPELFADDQYDFFVGKAEYIKDKENYFWDIVLESHKLVDSVLLIEKRLSQTYPSDQQYCYDERGTQLTQTQCKEYAKAYSDRMNGMVEERMRQAILAVGSAWYTAWIDAGQPELPSFALDNKFIETKSDKELESSYKSQKIKGRQHDQ